MKRTTVGSWALILVAAGVMPSAAFAQSLSAALGATKLDGLSNFNNCQNQSLGYREKITADRLDARLAQSPALSAEQRDVWQAEIRALRAVTPSTPKFVPPDPKQPQRDLMALTDQEQQAINSMAIRFGQEINLECEKKYGGMTRYSPGSDQSGQKRYEEELRAKMVTPIDIATVPITALPSPFPKTQAEMQAEQQAKRDARHQQMQAANQTAMQGVMAKMTVCQQQAKGLRLSLQADYMQKHLDASQGLSAKERSEWEADIRAVREAAAQGLDLPAAVDPANPMRAMMRLSTDESIAMGTEYGQKYMAEVMACQAK